MTVKLKGRLMPKNSVEMGWGAPPMKEQHPVLSDHICEQFDADNEAICRLSLRGILTQSQASAGREKYVKQVEKAIRAALTEPMP
jgi:hypothetical protein